MRIIALEHELPGAASETFPKYAIEEARKVWELYQSGLLRELYFRADRDEVVLVLECVSVAEADAVLAELPFVREGLIHFELVALKAYPGFERLFAKD